MFNYATVGSRFRPYKVVGGTTRADADSYRTLYAGKSFVYIQANSSGPDPADPERVLLRKIVQIGENTYAYEETRITPNPKEPKCPEVHTQMNKIHDFDFKEDVSAKELQYRGKFGIHPNVLGFSMYYRHAANGQNHFSIVENSLYKASETSWAQWW